MPKLLLSGDWNNAGEMTLGLLQAGFQLELVPVSRSDGSDAISKPGLQLAAISASTDFPTSGDRWLAWLRVDNRTLMLAAYQAGAQAVFPLDIPPTLLAQALRPLGNAPESAESLGVPRKIQYGDPIFLTPGSVLFIHEGVLATTMVHGDGVDVLLGLTGAGQMLVAHPDDECLIQMSAHTQAIVSSLPWEQAMNMPDFAEKLRVRLQQMEAWAAMQARPYLDQRVLGILSLLAEQFGVPHSKGTLINVRLTHAQLAAAVGATRTTITRVLGELRVLGKIDLDDGKKHKLFILQTGAEHYHK